MLAPVRPPLLISVGAEIVPAEMPIVAAEPLKVSLDNKSYVVDPVAAGTRVELPSFTASIVATPAIAIDCVASA